MRDSNNTHLRLKIPPTQHEDLTLSKYQLHSQNQIWFKNIYILHIFFIEYK